MTINGVPYPTIILTDRDLACMNALKVSFASIPTMIWCWLMNRNVLAETRSVLGQIRLENPVSWESKYGNTVATDTFITAYYAAADSNTQIEFYTNQKVLFELDLDLANYLDQHWWKYKERVVKCWTKHYKHVGFQDTSPLERTHAKCKFWVTYTLPSINFYFGGQHLFELLAFKPIAIIQ
ncbi:unnamed protein product [Phytophthora fragariaefolia]|uniref:Unnamed protein product n=1 Tax=Phytophthora fragariaefolia TaxID=1490495 RepID=A0A9W6YLD9_9STRA|nr:unnamed protein product [Phytophthora fragariaefolia]